MTEARSMVEVAADVRSRRVSAVSVLEDCLARIERSNRALNAFREVYGDEARDAASRINKRVSSGEDPGLLAGVPIAIKDNLVTDFGITSCGSRMLVNYRSPFSATVVQRLQQAGAIIVGKTNCDEFAMGSSTENCTWGPVRNPHDPSRVPGGSSGGSAAAVAAGMVSVALGSDTGGSIRQPASMTGIVGIKPSYGRVSRYGLVAFGSSLDQIGPMARNVKDAASVLQVIAGADRCDSTCSPAPVPDYLSQIDAPIQNLRIGVPREYRSAHNDSAVNDAVDRAIEAYRSVGATIVDVDLPLTDYGIATYYIIATAEASSNLARFDGIRYGHRAKLSADEDLFDLYAKSRAEGFGPEVQRRIMLGTYVLSAGYYDAYYKRALQVRRLIKQEYDAAFAKCDALLGPVSPTPAFGLGEKADPLSMYLADVYTVNANIAGICGMSIPAGYSHVNGKQLPIGVQLQCQAFDEMTMLRAARMLETSLVA